MTPFIKKNEIKKNWYLINAENVVVGRLASYISNKTGLPKKSIYNRIIELKS